MTSKPAPPLVLRVGNREVRPGQTVMYVTERGIKERALVVAVNGDNTLHLLMKRIAQKDVELPRVEFSMTRQRGKATWWSVR